MKKLYWFIIWIILTSTILTMKLRPERIANGVNRQIIIILAAHLEVGVIYSQFTKEFQYDDTSFYKILDQFLSGYSRPTMIQTYKSRQAESSYQLHLLEIKNFRQKFKQIIKNEPNLTFAQEDSLAKEVLDSMNKFYESLYGIKTDDYDKYVALLTNTEGLVCNRFEYIHPKKKVLSFQLYDNLPSIYQHFIEKSKRKYSICEQDGIIQEIFQIIKLRDQYFVEIGNRRYYNSNFLRQYKKWKGLIFNDGTPVLGIEAENTVKKQKVTPENVLDIFKKYNISKRFDFLSIGMNGHDYWVMKQILKEYRPAVIACQFNPNFPIDISVSIPKNLHNFTFATTKFFGASIRAIYDLGKSHDYEYVYHAPTSDIIFVRGDLLSETYRGMTIDDTYDAIALHNPDLSVGQFQKVNMKETSSAKIPFGWQNSNTSTIFLVLISVMMILVLGNLILLWKVCKKRNNQQINQQSQSIEIQNSEKAFPESNQMHNVD